jgi:TolA-binding protein
MTMTRPRLLAIGLVAGLLSAAPVGAQNREHLQMLADLRMVHEEVARLQAALNQLGEQNKTIAARLDKQDQDFVKRFADQGLKLNELAGDLRTLREKLDTNSVSVQRLTAELEAIRKGTESVLQLVTQLIAQVQAATLGLGAQPGGEPGGAGPPPTLASPQAYFQAAMGHYAVGQFELAVEGFKDVVAKFPDSPDAPRALFFIGESYLQLGSPANLKEAVGAYGSLIGKYSSAEDVPMAYYKQGFCYQQLRQEVAAVKNFELIMKQFPNTTAEVLAREALKKLGRIKGA